jgi:hypothetical protein
LPVADRRRRVWWLLAVIAATVGAVAVVLVSTRDHAVSRGGPLGCEQCDSVLSGLPVDPEASGTTGTILENHGNAVAVLDSVSFERRSRDLAILGPLALRAGDYAGPGLIGIVLGYPPPRTKGVAKAVAGFPVRPSRSANDAVELLVGFRPLRAGKLGYDAVWVHYHVGGKKYLTRYPTALLVCAPAARYSSGRCG